MMNYRKVHLKARGRLSTPTVKHGGGSIMVSPSAGTETPLRTERMMDVLLTGESRLPVCINHDYRCALFKAHSHR